LLNVDQGAVADLSGVHVNTIRAMEASREQPIAGRAANVQRVQKALESLGVDFLNHGQPGVRLRAQPSVVD
jgi:hypothetical protein